MRRWSYTLLTVAMLCGAVLLRHAPAAGADAEPLPAPAAEEPQGTETEFVPSERLPADAMISFPADI